MRAIWLFRFIGAMRVAVEDIYCLKSGLRKYLTEYLTVSLPAYLHTEYSTRISLVCFMILGVDIIIESARATV